jgi:hypothetical protein
VWTITHPRKGYLKEPQLDYVKDISDLTGGILLQYHNSLDDELDNHWSNDFYGNLVSREDLYPDYSSAQEALRSYYEALLFKHKTEVVRLEAVVANLQQEPD